MAMASSESTSLQMRGLFYMIVDLYPAALSKVQETDKTWARENRRKKKMEKLVHRSKIAFRAYL